MSRIGKKPVPVPAGVKVNIGTNRIDVEGPLGKLEWEHRPEIVYAYNEGTKEITVDRKGDTRIARALHGLGRAMLNNMVTGVTKGYEKKLEIVGVGYLAALLKNTLQLRVGFANEIQLPIPQGLTVIVPDQTHVVIKGSDKQKVGQFAAEVRAVRKPEPYKGKGVRYEGVVVRRKAGKAVCRQ
jgi:large subunit ribosomal protein L6